MLSETSQVEKDKYYMMILVMCGILKGETQKNRIECGGYCGPRGWGEMGI